MPPLLCLVGCSGNRSVLPGSSTSLQFFGNARYSLIGSFAAYSSTFLPDAVLFTDCAFASIVLHPPDAGDSMIATLRPFLFISSQCSAIRLLSPFQSIPFAPSGCCTIHLCLLCVHSLISSQCSVIYLLSPFIFIPLLPPDAALFTDCSFMSILFYFFAIQCYSPVAFPPSIPLCPPDAVPFTRCLQYAFAMPLYSSRKANKGLLA